MDISVHLRRRPGHRAMPKMGDYAWPRTVRFTREQFASEFGATEDDINEVVNYCASFGLQTTVIHAAGRQLSMRGTKAQCEKAFGVRIRFGKHGPLNLPSDLAPIIRHVSGMGNALKRAPRILDITGVPTGTINLTPAKVSSLYNFPTSGGSGQIVGIMTDSGWLQSDVTASSNLLGISAPTINEYTAGLGGSNFTPNSAETMLDIMMVAAFAPGASIALLQLGGVGIGNSFIAEVTAQVHPTAGNPVPNILSWSFGFSSEQSSLDPNFTQLMEDAASLGITVLTGSGDWGSATSPSGSTVVQQFWPASNPWCTAVGGTIIGNVVGSSFQEWAWNDPGGTTGGGVSTIYAKPSWQTGVTGVPVNLGNSFAGRAYPDIAANASTYSTAELVYQGTQTTYGVGGTSAATPLYAGLIATINTSIGQPMGYLNPTLYGIGTGSIIRDVNASDSGAPTDNSFYSQTGLNTHSPGYPVNVGYDACTGLGVINGNAFLTHINAVGLPPELLDITLINITHVTGSSPAGFSVGTLNVVMNKDSFTGTFACNSSGWMIVNGNQLATTQTGLTPQVNHVSITATMTTAQFSPLTKIINVQVFEPWYAYVQASNAGGASANSAIVGPIYL